MLIEKPLFILHPAVSVSCANLATWKMLDVTECFGVAKVLCDKAEGGGELVPPFQESLKLQDLCISATCRD